MENHHFSLTPGLYILHFNLLALSDKDLVKCTCPDLKCTSPDLKMGFFSNYTKLNIRGADACASGKKAVNLCIIHMQLC